MDVPPLVLDRDGPSPLPVQVADGLREAATRGVLAPGQQLPSTRALAAALGVSRTTTAAAYDQLLAEGWLVGRRGVGTFVVQPPGTAAADGRTTGPASAPTRADRVPTRGDLVVGRRTSPEGQLVDLRAGTPCTEVLDRAAWRRAWRAAGDADPDQGADPVGDPGFRAAVVEHLLRHRGLPVDPGAVVGTSGTSAAVAEVAALLPPGARVAVEDPGYRRAAAALVAAGAVPVPVPVDEDGLVVDAVPAGVAAVCCTPAHQFPLGARLTAARRTRLVERARAEDFLVLEDDYDGELRYDVAPLPLLAALGPDVVVHLGTTSKTVSPTLGTGWLVAPPAVRDALVAARTATGTRPSRAGQRVLAALAGSGDLSRHLRRLRRELSARRDLVRSAVRSAGHVPVGDAAGAHLVVRLPARDREREVVAAAAAAGVLVSGLEESCRTSAAAGVVVGWAAPPRADLPGALERLATVLGAVPRA